LVAGFTPDILVTHTDTDGIFSAALFMYLSNVDLRRKAILFIEPPQLAHVVCSASNDISIVITDIGVNRATFEKLIGCLKNKRLKIVWFDHHVWLREEKELLEHLGVELHVERALSAAEVVAKSLGGDDSVVQELVSIVNNVDSWIWSRWEAPFVMRLVDYDKSRDHKLKVLEHVLRALRSRDLSLLMTVASEFAEEYVDIELKALSDLCRRVVIEDIAGAAVAFAYKRYRIPNSSIIGNFMLHRCNADIAVIINEDLSSLSFRSIKIDVSELAKRLGGGGHKNASGAPLNLNPLNRIILRLLAQLIPRLGESIIIGGARSRIRKAFTS